MSSPESIVYLVPANPRAPLSSLNEPLEEVRAALDGSPFNVEVLDIASIPLRSNGNPWGECPYDMVAPRSGTAAYPLAGVLELVREGAGVIVHNPHDHRHEGVGVRFAVSDAAETFLNRAEAGFLTHLRPRPSQGGDLGYRGHFLSYVSRDVKSLRGVYASLPTHLTRAIEERRAYDELDK